ncbi:MAG: large protein, partial [Verrucomicrobiales bacterium]|nr:large protein [Verrucomicrobiales bacterium]
MKTKNLFAAILFAMIAFRAFGQSTPQVTLTMPTNGATFFAPANIYLRAEASDTNGIAFTQIIAGTTWMGSAKTNVFLTVWTNVPIGTYLIRGEAMNNLNIRGTSAPVSISVISNTTPTVALTVADSQASEPGDNVGTFNVSRSGDVTTNLTVLYSISGTASNGVDYVTLPTSIVIPAGSSNATIVVQPIDDTKVESVELVTLELKTNAAYRLGSITPVVTTVYIYDNETNHAPTVQMVNPHDGDSFSDPISIVLTAEASDVDGSVPTVSFARNGTFISYGTKNPSNNLFTAIWTNVPAGSFAITSTARDAINTAINTTSAPVNITVLRTNAGPYVSIYNPGNGRSYTNISILTFGAYTATGDATHLVKQVDFFLGTALFGTVTNAITSGNFTLQWTNPPSGTYVLTARAMDDGGASTVSAPSTFTIVSNLFVTVTATDTTAAEPGTDTGKFTIARTGSTADSLLVNYKLTGTASNGVDYSLLPGSVTIPAGASNAIVIVQPLDDTLIETTETVTLSLLISNTVAGTIAGSPSSATVSIYDNDTNQAPTVVLFNPTNGSSFNLPTNILLQAEAHDSDGSISGVSFYRGTNWIGTVYGTSSNSTPPIFNLLWTNPPIGEFLITARAYDNLQKAATSAPVQVVIKGETISNSLPTVSIYYPTNGSKFTSPTNVDLVAIASESNGVVATVQFFANGNSLGVATNNPLSAQPGNVFRVTWTSPLPGNYALTAKATDTNGASTVSTTVNVTILSNTPPNLPPTVNIQSPASYSVFYGPTNITLTAQATDSDGQIARVYFMNGTQILGRVTNAPYSLIWSNVQPGSYGITAKAIDNLEGSAVSAPVYITVKSLAEFSFVSRSAPLWYVPGVKMTVKLQASPKTNTLSYVVHDSPPAGWTINSVGENGSIDTGGLGVTFGPFTDKLARTFTYTTTPPSGESGEKRFVGTGTASVTNSGITSVAVTSPITGVTTVTRAQAHPADLNPTNFFIETSELDAYTLAWKRCEKWPVSPSPVPINYLTRAAYIVQGGGPYAISTNSPSPLPPLIWVRDATVLDITSNTLSGSVPWTTNNYGSAIA